MQDGVIEGKFPNDCSGTTLSGDIPVVDTNVGVNAWTEVDFVSVEISLFFGGVGVGFLLAVLIFCCCSVISR